MEIKEIIEELKGSCKYGFQITKKNGLLRSTWLIFLKENHLYYFDINEDIIFNENHKYSKEEIEVELNNFQFEIDCEIH